MCVPSRGVRVCAKSCTCWPGLAGPRVGFAPRKGMLCWGGDGEGIGSLWTHLRGLSLGREWVCVVPSPSGYQHLRGSMGHAERSLFSLKWNISPPATFCKD